MLNFIIMILQNYQQSTVTYFLNGKNPNFLTPYVKKNQLLCPQNDCTFLAFCEAVFVLLDLNIMLEFQS